MELSTKCTSNVRRHSLYLMFVIIWILSCFFTAVTSTCPELEENVATANVRNIVIGRCHEWQTITQRHSDIPDKDRMTNCTLLWETFSSGFSYKSLCHVSTDAFRDFISAADDVIPPNKQLLFYSYTHSLAKRYTNSENSLWSLENTLAGHMVDNLHFCASNNTANGLARDTLCPSVNPRHSCPASAEMAFWMAASINFALKASGKVRVMLNASGSPILRNNSFFTRYELPNLRPSHVTSVHILLMNNDPSKDRDPCSESSINWVKEYFHRKHIPVFCEENPRDALLQYCLDQSYFPAACHHLLHVPSSLASVTCQLLSHVAFCLCLIFIGVQFTVRRQITVDVHRMK